VTKNGSDESPENYMIFNSSSSYSNLRVIFLEELRTLNLSINYDIMKKIDEDYGLTYT
jgi:hypothetical protein